jgi:hypothetical protein
LNDGADVLAFGRDPDQPGWWQVHRRLAAAAAATALIGAGITVGVLASRSSPPAATRPPEPMATMLSGAPLRPGSGPGPLLLGGPAGVRLLNVSDQVPATAGEADGLPAVTTSSVLGPSATVEIASVAGGVVALVNDDPHPVDPAVGEALFIPVTARGPGLPRLIAEANYLAVAPNQRDIWVEQFSVPPGRDAQAWLVSESGRRLSAVIHLNRQSLLAATVAGLLIQGPSGEGASLMSPSTGIIRSVAIPPDALVVAVNADDIAWMAASCATACSLHVTSLQRGIDTVIPLPLSTLPDEYTPALAAFDPAGRRLALVMQTTNREDRITATSVYVVTIGSRRLTELPGGPIPLSAIPARLGAVPAGSPDVVSVHWAGSGLWIVATNGEDSQVAYWADRGSLRVLAPMPGAIYTFSTAAG